EPRGATLIVEKKHTDNFTILYVEGLIKLGESAEFFSAALENVLKNESTNVIIDFTKIDYIDSTGIGEMVGYLGKFSNQNRKPIQGIPLLEYGGGDEYELSPEEVALTCASHGGEPLHVSTAAALLRKGEFDESDLLCGAHMPYDEKSAAELRAAGEEPSPLHNNCSGKHAGMLLATRVMDVPSSRYIDPDHPI